MSWSESVSDMAYLLTCSRLSCLRFPQHLTKNYSIEERLKEEWMHVMYRPSAKKKNKNGPCRELTVKEEVDVSSEVRLNITRYYHNFFWNLVSSKLQQTVLSNTVILTEINEVILLSIEGYFVWRDRYAVFRKLPHSRKLYLCMNSASRIFKRVRSRSAPPKKNMRGWLVYIAHQHRTPNEWSKKLCQLINVRTQTIY